MLHKSTRTNDSSTTAVLERDLVADMKIGEMKQAILKRFCYLAKPVIPEVGAQAKTRSPYWHAVDEEC